MWYHHRPKYRQLNTATPCVRSSSLAKTKLAVMSTAAATAPDPKEYRLPTNVKATHYDITIKTDLENLTFNGIAKVRYALVAIPGHPSI